MNEEGCPSSTHFKFRPSSAPCLPYRLFPFSSIYSSVKWEWERGWSDWLLIFLPTLTFQDSMFSEDVECSGTFPELFPSDKMSEEQAKMSGEACPLIRTPEDSGFLGDTPCLFQTDCSVFLGKGRWELPANVEASQKHRNKYMVLNKSSISPEVRGCLWGTGSLLTQISRPGALWCWLEALQGVSLHGTPGGWAALSKHKHAGSSVPT